MTALPPASASRPAAPRLLSRLRTGLRLLAALLAAVAFCVAPAPTPAAAQEGPDTEQAQSDDSQLPEIAPREFEIRGQRQIDFPSLERQPLRGFASPPSVPTLPPERLPYVPTYRQERAELPQSLPEPTMVSSQLSSSPPPAQGMIEARGGRYFSRHLGARVQAPLSTTETITLSADYDGMEGFEPFEGSSLETPSDDLDARLAFETRRPSVTFEAGLFGRYDDYTLYGAQPLATSPELAAPERSSVLGGADLDLQVRGPVTFEAGAAYHRSSHDTRFLPDSIGRALTLEEGRLAVSSVLSFDVARRTVRLDADVATAGFGSRSALDGDVRSADAGGAVVLVDEGGLRVRAGARVLAFSAAADPDGPTTSGTATATFISPSATVEWTPTPAVTVYARNRPALHARSVADVYDRNPFAGHAPSVRPTLATTRVRTGVEIAAGPVRIDAHGGYRYAPTFLYFVPSPSAGFLTAPTDAPGVFDTAYGSAEIFEAGARAALQGPDRVQASVGLSVRDGTLVGPGVPIPNFAPVTGRAAVTYSFADADGFVRVSGTFESPRFVDRTETTKVGSYLSADLEGAYALTDLIDLTAALQNLGSGTLERWERYPRPPAIFSAGLRIHW
jgi:hypothetical protein